MTYGLAGWRLSIRELLLLPLVADLPNGDSVEADTVLSPAALAGCEMLQASDEDPCTLR